MATTYARRVRVHGHVQGVFFRASCQDEAQRREVTGWVGNEPDGTVEAFFEGSREGVEAMVAWCRTGPDRARVSGVEATQAEPEGFGSFEVR